MGRLKSLNQVCFCLLDLFLIAGAISNMIFWTYPNIVPGMQQGQCSSVHKHLGTQVFSYSKAEALLVYIAVVLIIVHKDGCRLLNIQITNQYFPDLEQSRAPNRAAIQQSQKDSKDRCVAQWQSTCLECVRPCVDLYHHTINKQIDPIDK